MDDRTQYLLTARPLPLLAKMSAPNSIAFFIQASVSMTEVWFVGQLGSSSLAAMALVFPMLMLTQTLSAGAMGGAVASAIARALGAGERQRAEQLIWHALALAVIGALLLFTLFWVFGAAFLRFLGGNNDTHPDHYRLYAPHPALSDRPCTRTLRGPSTSWVHRCRHCRH